MRIRQHLKPTLTRVKWGVIICSLVFSAMALANEKDFNANKNCGNTSLSNLDVSIENIKNAQGEIELILIPIKDKEQSPEMRVKRLHAKKGLTSWSFKNIEKGTYIIFAYHDENNNENFDVSFLGNPEEGFGLSGIEQPTLEDLSFSNKNAMSIFQVDDSDIKVQIPMKY